MKCKNVLTGDMGILSPEKRDSVSCDTGYEIKEEHVFCTFCVVENIVRI